VPRLHSKITQVFNKSSFSLVTTARGFRLILKSTATGWTQFTRTTNHATLADLRDFYIQTKKKTFHEKAKWKIEKIAFNVQFCFNSTTNSTYQIENE
jgi:hypothetical protein